MTGKGVDLLQRRKRQKQEDKALLAFYAEDRRLPTPLAEAYARTLSANEKKEVRGKTLNYEKEDKETRVSPEGHVPETSYDSYLIKETFQYQPVGWMLTRLRTNDGSEDRSYHPSSRAGYAAEEILKDLMG